MLQLNAQVIVAGNWPEATRLQSPAQERTLLVADMVKRRRQRIKGPDPGMAKRRRRRIKGQDPDLGQEHMMSRIVEESLRRYSNFVGCEK